jgi:tetratricopeptide (TPR) repeat protein
MMRRRRNGDAWRAALAEREGSSVLATVTAMAFDCVSNARNKTGVDAIAARRGDLGGTPLLQFTAAICRGDADRLASLLLANPRFAEINYFLGQLAMGQDLEEADQRLQLALAWRGNWPAALLAVGDVAMVAEGFDRAADFDGRTLALVTDNRDAQIRRVRALSYGGRYDAALDAAIRLLASGRWYRGEALYWKALTRHSSNATMRRGRTCTRQRS